MEYRILGPFHVARDGVEVGLGSGKQRALLALLLLHANEAVSSDRLIDQLWGEAQATSSAKVLHNYVWSLRRLLGDGVLITRGRGYELRVEPGELDLDRFNDQVADGRQALAAGDPARAAAALGAALDLWRGPPLTDFAFEQFVLADIERLDGLRLAVLIDRIDADLQLGRHNALIGELETLVAEHPLQERLRGQLMIALYRSGRQAEALQVYQATRRALVDELGIEPGLELQRLEQAILVHDPSLEPPTIARSAAGPTAEAGTRRPRTRLVVVALLLAIAIAGAGVLVVRERGHRSIAAVPGVRAIDPKTNKPVGAVPVDNLPIRVAADNEQVLVLSSYGGTMSIIDSTSSTVASTVAVSTSNRHLSSIVLAAGQGWVAYNGILAVIRSFGSVTARIPFERSGYGDIPDVAAGGGSIWVTSLLGREVIRVDRATLRIVARVRTRAVPLAIATGREGVWVAGFDKSSKAGVLIRIDPTQDTVSAPIPLPGIPGDLAVGYGGVWATVNSEDAVWRINPATGSVVRTIQVGSGPVAVAVGDGSVWVVNEKDGTVSRIDPATNRVVATIRVGGSPRDVAVGSGRVWVVVL